MNHKDERIFKLHLRGLSLTQIARKIGTPENIQRVKEGLQRKGVLHDQVQEKLQPTQVDSAR